MAASIAIRKACQACVRILRQASHLHAWGAQLVRGMVWAMLSLGIGSTLACGSDTASSAPIASSRLYLALQLNQHALIMALTAPYDTVQLTATPLSGDGTPLAGLGPVTFSSKDSSVTVSPTGLVTARYVTPGLQIPVVASLRDETQGVTHYDTAFVVVTATPTLSALQTFSMQPAPGDSAKRPLAGISNLRGEAENWPVTAVDSAGDTVCSKRSCTIPVYYHSSKPVVATINRRTGVITKNDTGYVVLSAQTLVFGHPYRDSVNFRVGLKTSLQIRFNNPTYVGPTYVGPDSSRIVLGVGSHVHFASYFYFGVIQVTFSDPAFADSVPDADFPSPGSGNFSFGCDSVVWFDGSCDLNQWNKYRRFPRAGTVQMHIVAPGFPPLTYELDIVRD